VIALPEHLSMKELSSLIPTDLGQRVHHIYPVVDDADRLVGVVTRRDLRRSIQEENDGHKGGTLRDIVRYNPVIAFTDEPLRIVIHRMAETGLTRFPVVERENPTHLIGTISLNNLLSARVLYLEAERRREKVLQMPRIRGGGSSDSEDDEAATATA